MKKNIFRVQWAMVLACTALLISCSSTDETEPAGESASRAINFTANTEFSRAGDITTNNLKSFNVYAYTGSTESPGILMNNVTVTKNGNNAWTYSPTAYWPSKESVDFYAFAPASWVGTASPLGAVAYDSYPGSDDII